MPHVSMIRFVSESSFQQALEAGEGGYNCVHQAMRELWNFLEQGDNEVKILPCVRLTYSSY